MPTTPEATDTLHAAALQWVDSLSPEAIPARLPLASGEIIVDAARYLHGCRLNLLARMPLGLHRANRLRVAMGLPRFTAPSTQ